MVNYDPQTYDSWPDSAQGVPDLNIIAGLPSVSGYTSIVNGNYESVTHTHEQDDLDIGQLSSGTLDRLDLREVVTLPEYFLVPLRSAPTAVGGIAPASENISSDPLLPRGYGIEYNETAYPFYPGPRPALHAGETASWFFGESIRPDSATLVLKHPAASGTLVSFGTVSAEGSTNWGAPVQVSAGNEKSDGPAARGRRRGRRGPVDTGSLPSYVGVVTVAGHAYELGGSLSSTIVPGPWHLAGLSQGYAVFTLQKPPTPITATTIGGRQLPVGVISSTRKSEVVRIVAPATASVLRSVAWDSAGGPPCPSTGARRGASRSTRSTWSSRSGGVREGPRDLPLRAEAPPAGERPEPGRRGLPRGPARRVAGAPAASGGRRCDHGCARAGRDGARRPTQSVLSLADGSAVRVGE